MGKITASCVAIAPGRFGSPYAYGNGSGVFQRGSDLYMVCSNPGYSQNDWANTSPTGTAPPVLAQAHILKSIDQGATWLEVDAAGTPSVSIFKSAVVFRGLTSPVAAVQKDANTLLVAYFVWDYTYNDPAELRFSVFDLSTDTWGAETAGGPTSTTVQNLSIAYRGSDGALILNYDGLETVGMESYSRVFYVVYSGGWGAGTPVDGSQTGSTSNYFLAGAVSGDGNRTHLFYALTTLPDTPGTVDLYQNTLTGSNALVGRALINTLVYTGASGGMPNQAPFSTPVTRLVSGLTNLYIAYVADADQALYYETAVSADTPVFSNLLIGGTVANAAGIFNCGLLSSAGLSAATLDSGFSPVYTGSADGVAWDPMASLTIPPDPSTVGNFQNFFGLNIDVGAGGFPSAGIVVNSLFSPPG